MPFSPPRGTWITTLASLLKRESRALVIKKVYEPMKFFTPPYETVQSLKVRLEGMYADVQLGNVKSIAWFVCKKVKYAEKMEEGHHE